MIYLDHAATTPISKHVRDVISTSLADDWANASATYTIGREAKKKLNDAIKAIARAINARPDQIIVTSGATESTNSVIRQLPIRFESGHVITSTVEHPSVMKTMEWLETRGFEVTYLPVNELGELSVDAVEQAIRPDTKLVSLMAVNNETGVRFPIKEIGKLLEEREIWFHVDSVQAVGTTEVDMRDWSTDFASFSAHKFNGPKGRAILYCKEPHHYVSVITGGGQNQGHRAGTENLPYILGMAAAFSDVVRNRGVHLDHYASLEHYLISALHKSELPIEINGSRRYHSPHILNLWLKGISSSQFLILAYLDGIAVSAGSACSAGSVEPSPVLKAIFTDRNRINESIRVSFGPETTTDELDQLVNLLITTFEKIVIKKK